ncbi:hypothetical protein [Chengkuizengella axinellae]|uniref:Uncharacterized protein n=1 Tax=Chengkuizengella axinellae TaxID=3064388 RepID=A0ABT9IY69_9BACL|nr:hypothetical protein [Chengkuizengella sp. 2205SS18-9]MDP5274263.1 hypothetical protein [Chengkuizengella sp. 2205SS18-9]
MTSQKNFIADILKIIGYLCFSFGFILWIAITIEFGILIGIDVMLGFGVSGVLFLAFSEVIKLLQGIYNQGEIKLGNAPLDSTSQESESKLLSESELQSRSVNTNNVYEVTNSMVWPSDAEEITGFYKTRGMKIKEILSTTKENYYMVLFEEGSSEVILLGGSVPKVIESLK